MNMFGKSAMCMSNLDKKAVDGSSKQAWAISACAYADQQEELAAHSLYTTNPKGSVLTVWPITEIWCVPRVMFLVGDVELTHCITVKRQQVCMYLCRQGNANNKAHNKS